MKRVAILSKYEDEFESKKRLLQSENPDTDYIRVSNIEHTNGYIFDSVIYTSSMVEIDRSVLRAVQEKLEKNQIQKMYFSKTKDVKSPTRGTSGSAGIDFFVPNDFVETTLVAHDSIVISSGIRARVPHGYALIAFNKSGVATKKGMQVGACVVDEDYQGEIHIHLTKTSGVRTTIEPGDKITQFVLLPVLYAEPTEVPNDKLFRAVSERGAGWQGSTGIK